METGDGGVILDRMMDWGVCVELYYDCMEETGVKRL